MSEPHPNCSSSSGSKRQMDRYSNYTPKKMRKSPGTLSVSEKEAALNIFKQSSDCSPAGSHPSSQVTITKTAQTAGISNSTVDKVLNYCTETKTLKSPSTGEKSSSKYDQIERNLINTPKKKRKCRGALSVSEKEVVVNIFKEFSDSWPPGSHPSSQVIIDKTAQTAGISSSTVYKILNEYTETKTFKSPSLGKQSSSKYDQMDNMTLSTVRRTVHNFFFNNEFPTIDKVLINVNADDALPNFSRSGLYRILKRKMQFRFAKLNRKCLLLDKNEIVAWRLRYLEKIANFRRERKKIYYLGETWINEGHPNKLICRDETVKSATQEYSEDLSIGLKAPTGKEKRLIIGHVGSSEGFLPGVVFIFDAKKTQGDYTELDAFNFEKWFAEILAKIENGSVVVLDNATYHSRKVERVPTTATRKSDIQEWLATKNIPYNKNEVRGQLLLKVNEHKHNYQAHIIDDMAREKGVTVLRIPPYHCELNPMEHVWPQLKYYIACKNKKKSIAEIKVLIPEAIASVTPEKWQNCIEHVLDEEKKMRQLDVVIDDMVEKFIVNVGEFSSDTNDDADSDS